MVVDQHVIVVGPTRTGSTSIFRSLSKLDCIVPSRIKELNYFIEHRHPERSEYLAEFRHSQGHFFLEASPKYFGFSKEASMKIRQTLDNVKIIIILRNPMERLLSIFTHIMTKRSIAKYSSLEELAAHQILDLQDITKESSLDSTAFLEGAYHFHLTQWIKAIGRDNVGIYFYEDIHSQEFLRHLLNFLGIKVQSEGLSLSHENQSRTVKHNEIHKIAKSANDKLEPLFNRFPAVRRLSRNAYYSFNENRGLRASLSGPLTDKFERIYYELNQELPQFLRSNGYASFHYPQWIKDYEHL